MWGCQNHPIFLGGGGTPFQETAIDLNRWFFNLYSPTGVSWIHHVGSSHGPFCGCDRIPECNRWNKLTYMFFILTICVFLLLLLLVLLFVLRSIVIIHNCDQTIIVVRIILVLRTIIIDTPFLVIIVIITIIVIIIIIIIIINIIINLIYNHCYYHSSYCHYCHYYFGFIVIHDKMIRIDDVSSIIMLHWYC